MKALPLALAALLSTAPLLAAAQWQWLDNSGHKVFSDQPPPADIPSNRILRQPGQHAFVPPPADVAAAAANAAASHPVAGKDKDLEAKKKEADAQAAAKKQAADQQFAQARADNCTRAKSGKATLESGVRVVQTNGQGEREYMGDDQRASEMKRLDGIIASDCK